MNTLWHLTTVYLSPESGAGGGASGNTVASPNGDGATAPAQTPATPETTTPVSSEKTYTYREDRSNWIDPDHYRRAEALVNRTASELERARGMIAEQNRRIAALAGVAPVNPEAEEAQKIADAFYALPQFQHLRYITPQFLQAVGGLIQDGASVTAARDHVWNAHTDRFLDRLDDAFASELGVDTLTPGQQRKLRAAFGALIPDERSDPQGHAAFAQRYEANDDTLIHDFVKEYVADMLEPARRQAMIPTMRRPVPRSGPAAPVVTQKGKTDYSTMTVQQMLEHAEKEAESVGR